MEKFIRTSWVTGKDSITLVIPKQLAQEMGLSLAPCYCSLEKTKEGLLLRKIDMEKI